MIEYFEKQEGGKTLLTQDRIDSLSVKKTFLGKDLKVGDRLLFAKLHLETKVESNRKIYELIQLTEDEMDQYELEDNSGGSLPLIKLKNL